MGANRIGIACEPWRVVVRVRLIGVWRTRAGALEAHVADSLVLGCDGAEDHRTGKYKAAD